MDDSLARHDVRRQLELLYASMRERKGALTKVLEAQGIEHEAAEAAADGPRLDRIVDVMEVMHTEGDLLIRLGELLDALVATFPDLPEDQRPKPN